MLLQVSVREIHNRLVSDTDDDGLKEAIDAENNIIISDSTLRSLLSPQLIKCHQDTRSCKVVSVVYLPKVCIPNYYHGLIIIKKIQGSQPKFSKQKVWGKIKFAYMKYIKIQSCHMGVIFMPNHMIWKRQQCVHIHSKIMR